MSKPSFVSCFLSTIVFTSVVLGADLRLDGGSEFGWETAGWNVVLDGVMGGQSSGTLAFTDSNTVMSFSGDIVMQGGGFSSVRKRLGTAVDLTPYEGIVVNLETTNDNVFENTSNEKDNAPLGLHLQVHDQTSYYGYASAFAIPLVESVGISTSVYLPMESFDRASRSGFQCRQNCQLDEQTVNEIDVYVLFQEGQFEVKIKSITAVEKGTSFAPPKISLVTSSDVKNLLESTIRSGSSLFNIGYGELCIAIYRSALNTLLAASYPDELSKDQQWIKGMACEGLSLSETQNKFDAAFTLRYTMDGILEEFGFLDPEEGKGADDWRPNVANAVDLSDQCQAVTSFGGPSDEIQVTVPTDDNGKEVTNTETNTNSKADGVLVADENDKTILIVVGVSILLVLSVATYFFFHRRNHDEAMAGGREKTELQKEPVGFI